MKLRHLAALGAVAAIIGIGSAVPFMDTAHADTDCNTRVIDTTNKRVLDTDAVNKSVTATSDATGADVYVRAMQTTPGGDAAVWFKDALRECRNWTGPDGVTPKPNLLVVQFGMDRTSSIQYGRNLTSSMDPKVDKVRSSVMGSQLKSGNFTKAITQTLSTVNDIYSGKNPFAAPPREPSAPINWSPFLTFLQWAGGILASAAALFYSIVFGNKFMRSYKSRKEERAEAKKNYDDVYARITDMVVSTDLNAELIRADAAATTIDFDYTLEPSGKLRDEFASINDEFTTLSGSPIPKDTESLRSRTKEYRVLVDRFESLLKRAKKRADDAEEAAKSSTPESKKSDLGDVLKQAKSLSKEVGKLPKWVDTSRMTKDIEDVNTLVTAALGKVDTLTRPEVNDAIDKASASLEFVNDDISEVNSARRDAENVVNKVEKTITEYRKSVKDVPDDVRREALNLLMSLSPRAEEYLNTLRSSNSPLTVKKVNADTALIETEYQRAILAPKRCIRDAEERRAENRRIAELEREKERKKKEKEEEEERRRRRARSSSYSSDSFSGGFAGGYLGSSFGSSSSSSYNSGSSWGGGFDSGGSSGSWGGGFDSGGSSGGW